MAWALRPKLGKWLLIALIGLSAVEVTYLSHHSNTQRGSIAIDDWNSRTRHNDYTHEAVEWLKSQDNPMFYRTDKLYGSVKSGYNDAMVQGYFGTKTYQSFNNNNLVNFLDELKVIDGSREYNTRWLVGVSQSPVLHPLMSIKWLLSTPQTIANLDYDIYEFKHKTNNIEVNENRYFIPMGIPFSRYISRTDFRKLNTSQRRRALYSGLIVEDENADDFPFMKKLRRGQIVSAGNLTTKWTELAQEAMQMEFFNQHQIKGTINMKEHGLLFFSIPFENGWVAKVDGAEVPIKKVHVGFTGIEVPEGQHQIDLEFVPPGLKQGKTAFWIALGVYALLLILTRGKVNFIDREWKARKEQTV